MGNRRYRVGENLRIGSMFSGVGGLDMAVHALFPGSSLAWLCENDDKATAVLDIRFPGVPNHRDITTIDWTAVEPVDVIAGGFPCQDISQAGKRAGIKEGTRSGLWFAMLDAVRVLRPRLLLLENVAAITTPDGGLDVVLGSLAEAGFDAEWTLLRASDVGAPHRRDRWFCVAYPSSERPLDVEPRVLAGQAGVEALRDPADGRGAATDTDGGRLVRGEEQDLGTVRPGQQAPRRNDADGLVVGNHGTDWGEYAAAIRRWEGIIGRPAPDPTDDAGRLSPDFVEWMMGWPAGWTDIPGATRSHRLKQCGNGVVPQQAYAAYTHLLDAVDAALVRQEVA